jgi:hypothetical protein
MSSFELSIGVVSNARLGRGSILRFPRGKHIVEIAEWITDFGSLAMPTLRSVISADYGGPNSLKRDRGARRQRPPRRGC